MGAAISSYDTQRRQLREALILATIQNPSNKDILSKITGLRRLVTEHPHLCATAAREAAHKFDYSPTSLEAAYHELDRLFTVYEAGRILKSAKMRKGPVACPLGHHAVNFASVKKHPEPKPPPVCGICDKKAPSGYFCSYCNYNVCGICCIVYCSFGHEMVLWTHEESDLQCYICNQHPIHSGYRCNTCEIDFCDMCTYRDGRAQITKEIFNRMEMNLKFMRERMSESPTADATIRNMKKTVGAGDSFPTILHLVRFATEVADTKETVRLEVILTRITNEVNRLRAILTTHVDLCKTHLRVKGQVVVYPSAPLSEDALTAVSVHEVSKLRVLADAHFLAKSVRARSCAKVACPLGHAASFYRRNPGIYEMQAAENGVVDASTILPPYCKICSMLADEGYNCSYCEYDLCQTCSVVFCSEGHAMAMWTIPEARGQRCYVCNKDGLTAGYHCKECFLNLCDMCTRKERRLDVREKWERELQDIIAFMHENKRRSDMARYLHWRKMSIIGSLGELCDYVRELRVCKMTAEKQIKFKAFIDKMKSQKTEIIANAEFSATAVRESEKHNGPDGWFFRTKREAKNELRRLYGIIELDRMMKRMEPRLESGVACPLGHALVPLKKLEIVPEPVLDNGPEAGWEDAMANSIKRELEQRRKIESGSTSSRKTLKPGAMGGSGSPSRGSPDPAILLFTPDSAAAAASSRLQRKPPGTADSTNSVEGGEGGEEVETEGRNRDKGGPTAASQWSVNQPVYRESAHCKTCLKDALTGSCRGKTCVQCEYDLCEQCLVMNCRRGHVLNIWTAHDAFEVSCDLCGKQSLLAGYNCGVCGIDICDRCTRREIRESMKMWPKRDIRKLLNYYESLQTDSEIARKLVQKAKTFLKAGGDPSMSELCHLFLELENSKATVDEEISTKKFKIDMLKYSLTASDF